MVVFPKAYLAYVEQRGGFEEQTDDDWFAQVSSNLLLAGVVLVCVATLGVSIFMLRKFFRKKSVRLYSKRQNRFKPVLVVTVVTLFLCSSSMLWYYTHLPHGGWEARANETTALATALYMEGAIAEPNDGLHAIAWTIFNRQTSNDYPDSIREIVIQGVRPGRVDGCQFSFACDGEIELPHRLCELHPNDTKVLGWLGCERRYAYHLLLATWWLYVDKGKDPTNGAVLYYTGQTPYWVVDCVEGSSLKVGSHTFCQSKWNN